MRVTRAGRWLVVSLQQGPYKIVEIKFVEIVQMLGTVMAAEHEHLVSVNHRGGTITRLGGRAFDVDGGPSAIALVERELVEIRSVVSIIPSENVHAILVPG